MSESDIEEVAEEFKHLFEGVHFKFEGLSSETEEEFTKLVQEMGAEVSNDAKVTLMPQSYFEKKKNTTKDTPCNINFIADSVQKGVLLDFKTYLFVPYGDEQLSDDEPLCYAARYFYKTDSCQECYYTKVFCKECAKESIKESFSNQDTNHIESATTSSFKSKHENINSPVQEVIEPSVGTLKRLRPSELEQNSSNEKYVKSVCVEKSVADKRFKHLSDVGNTTFGEGSSGITPEVIEISDSDSDTAIRNNKSSCEKIKRVSISDWLTSSKSRIPVQTENPAPLQSKLKSCRSLNSGNDDHEKVRYFRGDKWWLVQQDIPINERCTIIPCHFEPKPHPKHPPPQRFLSSIEKKILVKYLIVHNSMANAKGILVYQNMIKDGYLTHRSAETLRNCFRRTILDEIESYHLDKFHLDEFLKLRIKTITKEQKQNI